MKQERARVMSHITYELGMYVCMYIFTYEHHTRTRLTTVGLELCKNRLQAASVSESAISARIGRNNTCPEHASPQLLVVKCLICVAAARCCSAQCRPATTTFNNHRHGACLQNNTDSSRSLYMIYTHIYIYIYTFIYIHNVHVTRLQDAQDH